MVHGTRSPVWQQSFRFLVSHPRKALVLTVEHHDPLLGDALVGHVTIPLKALGLHLPLTPTRDSADPWPERRDVVQWFDLRPVPEVPVPAAHAPAAAEGSVDAGGGFTCGCLRVGLRWRPSALAAAEAQACHAALLMPPPSSEPPANPVEAARAAAHAEVRDTGQL